MINWRTRGSRTPYTEIGIRRVSCARCGKKPSVYQWNICALGNVYHGFCSECDIDLNELVLKFIGDPDWQEKAAAYRAKVLKETGHADGN